MKQPWDTYSDPQLKSCRVDFVQLVEIAIDDGVDREAILLARGDDDGARYLLSRCRSAVCRVCYETVLNGDAINGRLHLS